MNVFNKFLLILIVFSIFIYGCQKQVLEDDGTVKTGDTVMVDYAGGYDNGTLFDTSILEAAEKAGIFNPDRVYEPIQFVVGQGQVIQGLDEALLGMADGDAKTVAIPPQNAYGLYDENQVVQIPLEEFGNEIGDESVGQRLILDTPRGRSLVLVRDLNEDIITLDFNHPLAGERLTFAIILRGVQ
jgi:FKBP-type peptidyl-prolyl cis-trans isomerase 2|tara:strand:+ start:22 stop:576 length:555 start_codon:yes stop_codon:yes gene_type:complete